MKVVIFNETKILDIHHDQIKIYINNWKKKSELDKGKSKKKRKNTTKNIEL